MLPIFLQTLPFFTLIALGWAAGRTGFFPQEATAWLTKFVFYFALSAMLFRFAATLHIDELFDPRFVLAYLTGSIALWLVSFTIARLRHLPLSEATMEAHTSMTGNTGFLGVPMLIVLLGDRAIGPLMLLLAMDMIVFLPLITIIITGARHGRLSFSIVPGILVGVLRNPMIMSMSLGLVWSGLSLTMPPPLDAFLSMLGAAATPGALFAIGASLAGRRAERLSPAAWLSFAKLILHPLAITITALLIFRVEPFAAGVMIAAAALPVAGNVYIQAQYFGVAVQRVSTAILISTAASIVTIPLIIHWIAAGG